jgi:RNA polymerase primary sigma factor
MSIERIDFEINQNNFKYWINSDFSCEKAMLEIEGEMPDIDDFSKKKLIIQKDIHKVAPEIRQFYTEPLLSKKQEFHLFRKMNFYKYRTKLNFDAYKQTGLNSFEKVCLDYFSKYQETRNFIVSCNTRLTAQIIKKRKDFYADNLNDLISDSLLNIIKAADGFDYTRGFKFSTYCTWVLMNNSLRDHGHNKKFYENVSTNLDNSIFFDKLDEKQFENVTKVEKEEGINYDILKVLKLIKQRDDREHFVIVHCFGLLGTSKKTLKEISAELNLTKERVRQIRESGVKFIQDQIKEGNLSLVSFC